MKIGIIGQGFVGNAIYQKFKNHFNILTYDLDESKCNSSEEEVFNCKVVFICLPTPMDVDGSCVTTLITSTLAALNADNSPKTAIIKSTVIPGSVKNWNETYDNLQVVFNPEFLTEANAVQDFENQNRIILGGTKTCNH
jgi:UDPglucose 6-dehydrogenase